MQEKSVEKKGRKDMRDIFEGAAMGFVFGFIIIILAIWLVGLALGMGVLIYGAWCACYAIWNYYRAERICFENRKLFFQHEVHLAGWKNAVRATVDSCINGVVPKIADNLPLDDIIPWDVFFWIGSKVAGTAFVLLCAALTMQIVLAVEAGTLISGKKHSSRKAAESQSAVVNM